MAHLKSAGSVSSKKSSSRDRSVTASRSRGSATTKLADLRSGSDYRSYKNRPTSRPPVKAPQTSDTGTSSLAPAARTEVTFIDAMEYIEKFKIAYQKEPKRYEQFLVAMKDYQENVMGTGGLYEKVSKLLYDRPDLKEDFRQFLPETHPEAMKNLKRTVDVHLDYNEGRI